MLWIRSISSRRAPAPWPVLALLAVTALAVGCSPSRVVEPGAPPSSTLPSNYVVTLDSLLQTPRTIENQTAPGATPHAPAPFAGDETFRIVRAFILDFRPVFRFRLGADDFVLTRADGFDGLSHIQMQQMYHGLRVDGMGYSAIVAKDGSVSWMLGHFMPDIMVSTIPLFNQLRVGDVAVAALAPQGVHAKGTPALLISTYDRVPRLAWAAVVASDFTSWETWTVVLDATNGHVLSVYPNFILN